MTVQPPVFRQPDAPPEPASTFRQSPAVAPDPRRDDERRRPVPMMLLPGDPEPPVGAVILSDGLGGTAYQRSYTDGLWYSAITTDGLTWPQIANKPGNAVRPRRGPRLFLLHVPPAQ